MSAMTQSPGWTSCEAACATVQTTPEPAVGRAHAQLAPVALDHAEVSVESALEDAGDASGPAALVILLQAEADAIALHEPGHLARRQEHAALETLDARKAEARAIGRDDALGDGRLAAAGIGGFVRGTMRRAPHRLPRSMAGRMARAARWFLSTTQLTAPYPLRTLRRPPRAQVAELVDALVSGTSG